MSERILKALMQLFAIIAKVDGVTSASRGIVESFLKQQLSLELVDQYLALFDEFLEAHHQVAKRKDGSAKRTSLNSVKVLRICTQINEELTQKQKIVVLLRLIEFIHSSYEISEQELEFVQTVSETFNIEKGEFGRLRDFVEKDVKDMPDISEFLVIDGDASGKFEHAHHIYSETMGNGRVVVVYIPSVSMYACRYFGGAELNLNGQAMLLNKVYILTPGSSLRSSKVQPVYYSDIISAFLSSKTGNRITFNANNIEYKFKTGKLGLRGVNIQEESGRLIGIMGGSGAGKSTLLNVLNSNEAPTQGEVLINGINIHTQKDKIEGVIGHVSQDDLLIEELTVFQNLYYNAKLCFGNMGEAEITKTVDELLADLGLYEARNLKVGSPLEKTISGGQRKRLNIALELIREPSVLFVDEPTSGLSSRDSENIMDLLKELALKGKLVFVVIHQPSSDIFKMFDKLIILDNGGYPIYNGNPVDAVVYFKKMVNHVNSDESECPTCGNVNPEQIFNIIESKVVDEYGNLTRSRKVSPSEWNNFYREYVESKQEKVVPLNENPESTFNIPGRIKQMLIFMTRDVRSKLTNTQYMVINLLEAPVLAFILAYLVRFFNTDVSNKIGYNLRENDNLPAYMFMSVVVALFIGLTVSAEEIIRDRKILKRESFLNLSRSSYLMSKILIMFVLSAIQTFMFILVGNYILQIKGMWLDYWLVLFTTSCFANMLGLNISSAFNSAVTIYILIPFLIIPQLLLSGVIVKFEKLNPTITSQETVPVAGEMMASRWAFEALAVDQFKNNEYEKLFYSYEEMLSISDYKRNYWISHLRGMIDKCETNSKLIPAAAFANGESSKMRTKNDTMAFEQTRDLSLIRSEIGDDLSRIKELSSPQRKKMSAISTSLMHQLDSLNTCVTKIIPKTFNTDNANSMRAYLNLVNSIYMKVFNSNNDARDKAVNAQITDKDPKVADTKKEKFNQLKNDYMNDALSDLVTNKNEFNKLIEQNGKLIQRSDPIFLEPYHSNFANSHFFAPRKKIFGHYYDTFWVNLCVLWGMSILMIITLYFDVLRKIIDGLGNLGERFGKKKDQQ
ncbi:MAG: ATP-binding cassette domain-containing protein [Bacteroidetes bacterium]|nr:ATP-binding cassette domain-containing protein [Bacteroidota bacterium]